MNSPNPPRKVLGRGLDALLNPDLPKATSAQLAGIPEYAPNPNEVRQIPLASIDANPLQPRQRFRPESLQELADSIRAQGVLQPVLLRPHGNRLQLIAGERRFRAASLAGLTTIPALVKPLPDEQALELALIENLQREDLNPMEQARALQQLAAQFQMSQERIAQRTGKDRTSVANILRLLKLDASVQDLVEAGSLSMGHARALLAVPTEEQKSLADRAVLQGWSVRQMERAVRGRQPDRARGTPKPPQDPNIRDAEEQLARVLGARVEIHDRANRGFVAIAYQGVNDFQRLFERLMGQPG